MAMDACDLAARHRDPYIQHRAERTVGRALTGLGRYAEAEESFRASALGFEAIQPLLNCSVHEFVVRHPLGQTVNLVGELTPPHAVLVELLVE